MPQSNFSTDTSERPVICLLKESLIKILYFLEGGRQREKTNLYSMQLLFLKSMFTNSNVHNSVCQCGEGVLL